MYICVKYIVHVVRMCAYNAYVDNTNCKGNGTAWATTLQMQTANNKNLELVLTTKLQQVKKELHQAAMFEFNPQNLSN